MQNDTSDAHDGIDCPLTDPESLFAHDDIGTEQILREQDQSHFDTRRE